MVRKFAVPVALILLSVFSLGIALGAWELQQPAEFHIDPNQVNYIELRYYSDRGIKSDQIPSEWSKKFYKKLIAPEDIDYVCRTLKDLYIEEYPSPLSGEEKWRSYAIYCTYRYCFVFHMNNGGVKYFRWGDTMVNFDNHWCYAVGGEATGYAPLIDLFLNYID